MPAALKKYCDPNVLPGYLVSTCPMAQNILASRRWLDLVWSEIVTINQSLYFSRDIKKSFVIIYYKDPVLVAYVCHTFLFL